MACGKPIITTNYSACQDYVSEGNALLLQYNVESVPYEIVKADKNFYGHEWATPSTEHMGLLMNWVFQNQEEGKIIGAKARETVIEKYSFPVVSTLMNNFLKERGIT